MSDAAGESEAGGARSGRSAAAVAWAASLVIRSIRRTARLRFHGDRELRRREREDERLILAFWHRHLLLMPYVYRGRRIAVLVSRSRDGELIARTVAHFGIDVARGSTSRGGAAGLRDLLRKARAGYDLAFTPDGPRGPVGIVQPGVIAAAAATGWPVIPVALAASRCRRLASWDRFLVPLPGARVHFVCGPELRVERGEAPEVAAEELARRLDRAESEAERLAAARYAEEV
ncbi:MAG: lysophospholipid acyltransferase family protein [Thermoanaerobaculia bacterium]|nr:lysophospholipid acyltransferase family protein [Thermoanaerobaculia bacterium]MCZ7650805.1 lysophospholipid acyltransferase family protein [Thermoanaerobaculia bacterium]